MLKKRNVTKGFTLIELLVVVLIIGILAAVALPQYQKAVEKSKSVEALTLLKATAEAVYIYRLANGTYPTQFDELTVDIPWTGHTKGYTTEFAIDTLSNDDWSIQLVKDTQETPTRFYYIYVTRLRGAYRGGFFSWGFFSNEDYPMNTILCLERKSNGVIFPKNTGDYCQKVIHGSPVSGNEWASIFKVPF